MNEALIIIFTDGSCVRNGQRGARAAIGIYFEDKTYHHLNASLPLEGRQTNQRAELMACIIAIQGASSLNGNIVICTDSLYTIKCVTQWITKWKTNNYNNDKVLNRDLIMALDTLSKKYGVKYRHVRSHQKEPLDKASEAHRLWHGNEQADRLAKQGLL